MLNYNYILFDEAGNKNLKFSNSGRLDLLTLPTTTWSKGRNMCT